MGKICSSQQHITLKYLTQSYEVAKFSLFSWHSGHFGKRIWCKCLSGLYILDTYNAVTFLQFRLFVARSPVE